MEWPRFPAAQMLPATTDADQAALQQPVLRLISTNPSRSIPGIRVGAAPGSQDRQCGRKIVSAVHPFCSVLECFSSSPGPPSCLQPALGAIPKQNQLHHRVSHCISQGQALLEGATALIPSSLFHVSFSQPKFGRPPVRPELDSFPSILRCTTLLDTADLTASSSSQGLLDD